MADFNLLPLFISFAGSQSREGADEAVQTSLVMRVESPSSEWFAVGLAVQIEVTAKGLVGEGVTSIVGVGTTLAKRRNLQANQSRKA